MIGGLLRRLRTMREANSDPGYARVVAIPGEVRVSSPVDGVGVVALVGEHDLGTVNQVRAALERAQNEQGAVVVDLCQATFIDSSILGAILEGRRQATEKQKGYGVACDGSSEPVNRVLDVTGLRRELPVHESVDAALEAIRQRTGSA